MAARTCPMIARGSWDVADQHQKGAWHHLCATQSPVGFKGGITGAWLVFLNGSHRGEDARLPMGPCTIGAAWQSSLVLTGPEIGSHHATMVVTDTTAAVTPAGANRDVRVNGVRVLTTTKLEDGDLISFGELHGILRFAKLFTSGYVPTLRPRPSVAPTIGAGGRPFTAGWLIAMTGTRAGQDWRLVKGMNRLGSALGLEVMWPEGKLPPLACAIQCGLDAVKLASFEKGARVLVNGSPVPEGTKLRDSDRLRVNDVEFYLKCL